MSLLAEIQRVPCSAARAVQAFTIEGDDYIAIPQLAYDDPGAPPGMNGGSSGTDVLLLKRQGASYVPAGKLPGVGGEDAEFFTIDGTAYLAIACIRMGSGPYNYEVGQPIYVWKDGAFEPFQTILGYAAKEWRHFTIDGTHFLALAQNRAGDRDVPSAVFRWNGVRFAHFQDIASRGGYNFEAFALDGTTYLAHADHELPSTLYRWDGERFVFHQELVELGGRAFRLVEDGANAYLVVANIRTDSVLLRWDGQKFLPHQRLDGGPGARELAVVSTVDGVFVVRVNFITGGPQAPRPVLKSQIYRLENGLLTLVDEYDTCGGTDVTSFPGPDGTSWLAVSSGLNANIGFRSESVIYRFTPH